MKLYSTNNKSNIVELKEAVLKGLAEDNGLYMPCDIPVLPSTFFENIEQYSFQEIAFEVSKTLLKGYILAEDLKIIIDNAITFPAPIINLSSNINILELFHGPSLAFKDFGARFMAQIMGYFNTKKEEELVILVATSGDTGGAVASGFLKTKGIKVVILYPSGKVSHLQEQQLTTLGHNISALEVNGTFDDCQALVKKAFLDKELNDKIRLSSANSINIARLIPQMFYYFESYKQLKKQLSPTSKVVYSIPSGNFGNLTAGLIAQKMGLPIDTFIAATNQNDIVPQYLSTGEYNPKPSIATISNAMDVGNPSNFVRMKECFTWNIMKDAIKGYAFNDNETKKGIKEVYNSYNYIIDPHGSVGYLALKEYLKTNKDAIGIVLETAHPSKFKEEIENSLNIKIDIPERLAILKDKKKEATTLNIDFSSFKEWLIHNY